MRLPRRRQSSNLFGVRREAKEACLYLPVRHQNLAIQILILHSSAPRVIVCQYDEMRDEFRHCLGVYATHGYHTSRDGFLVSLRDVAARDNNIAHEHIVVRAELTRVDLFFLFNTVRDVGGFGDMYERLNGELVVREVCGG